MAMCMQKLKVITNSNHIEFEKKVNQFVENNIVFGVPTFTTTYGGNGCVNHTAYINYMGKEE